MCQQVLRLALIGYFLLGCASTPKYRTPVLSEEVQPPTLLVKNEPIYPREARQKGEQGKVNLYLHVSEQGKVQQVEVVESCGHKTLDDAAADYAKGLVFKAATRQGQPTSVWITWTVSYNLEPLVPGFKPDEYVENIRRLFSLATVGAGQKKEQVLEEILKAHDDFVRFLAADFDVKHNIYVRQFVQPEVEEHWKDFWPDWPLGFAIFHDFILRFPESDQAAVATARLLDLIKQDIASIKAAAKTESRIRRKKDLLLTTIYRFLSERYPQTIDEHMKPEADRYLQKDGNLKVELWNSPDAAPGLSTEAT